MSLLCSNHPTYLSPCYNSPCSLGSSHMDFFGFSLKSQACPYLRPSCCWHPSRSMSGSLSHFLLVFTQKSTFEWELYLKVPPTISLLIHHIHFSCFIFFFLFITTILYIIVIYHVSFLLIPMEYKPHEVTRKLPDTYLFN